MFKRCLFEQTWLLAKGIFGFHQIKNISNYLCHFNGSERLVSVRYGF